MPDSPADRAGVVVGDGLLSIGGEELRDVIQYQLLVDGADPVLDVDRGGLVRSVEVDKADGEPLGIEVSAAVFDQVRTCDNHCPFCFIYQLPKGMRKSLYLKDDDYRLSFLYGNFTTLTRFTEMDLERVVTERLSPLYVSIHATDPELRSTLLRNRRGATSLRWLRALLDHGIEVHGQIVVCPGLNDGDALEQTLVGVLDGYPELATLAVVPLGVSDHSNEADMRPHTRDEAAAVVDRVSEWQGIYRELLGRRLVYAADEYYLLAGRPFPAAETYEGFAMHEDGIGMARNFELEFAGESDAELTPATGFFHWVDGAPPEGYRAPRLGPVDPGCATAGEPAGLGQGTRVDQEFGAAGEPALGHRSPFDGEVGPVGEPTPDRPATPVALTARRRAAPPPDAPVGIVTGAYGAQVLGPLLDRWAASDVRLVEVDNRFFGGNIGVTGLLVGEDIARVLADEPVGHRYLLPDVCLSGGRFLDGTAPEDLPRSVEVITTSGTALRAALGDHRSDVRP